MWRGETLLQRAQSNGNERNCMAPQEVRARSVPLWHIVTTWPRIGGTSRQKTRLSARQMRTICQSKRAGWFDRAPQTVHEREELLDAETA